MIFILLDSKGIAKERYCCCKTVKLFLSFEETYKHGDMNDVH